MAVKIVAQDLEKAIAGSALLVAKSEDDIPSVSSCSFCPLPSFIPTLFSFFVHVFSRNVCDKP
jgi:hypothetical protein